MTSPGLLSKAEKFAKAREEIEKVLALWRAGKTSHESTLLNIELIMRETR